MCFRPASAAASGPAECPECHKTIEAVDGIEFKNCPFCGCDFTPLPERQQARARRPRGSWRPEAAFGSGAPKAPGAPKPPSAPAAPKAPGAPKPPSAWDQRLTRTRRSWDVRPALFPKAPLCEGREPSGRDHPSIVRRGAGVDGFQRRRPRGSRRPTWRSARGGRAPSEGRAPRRGDRRLVKCRCSSAFRNRNVSPGRTSRPFFPVWYPASPSSWAVAL